MAGTSQDPRLWLSLSRRCKGECPRPADPASAAQSAASPQVPWFQFHVSKNIDILLRFHWITISMYMLKFNNVRVMPFYLRVLWRAAQHIIPCVDVITCASKCYWEKKQQHFTLWVWAPKCTPGKRGSDFRRHAETKNIRVFQTPSLSNTSADGTHANINAGSSCASVREIENDTGNDTSLCQRMNTRARVQKGRVFRAQRGWATTGKHVICVTPKLAVTNTVFNLFSGCAILTKYLY